MRHTAIQPQSSFYSLAYNYAFRKDMPFAAVRNESGCRRELLLMHLTHAKTHRYLLQPCRRTSRGQIINPVDANHRTLHGSIIIHPVNAYQKSHMFIAHHHLLPTIQVQVRTTPLRRHPDRNYDRLPVSHSQHYAQHSEQPRV